MVTSSRERRVFALGKAGLGSVLGRRLDRLGQLDVG